MNNKRLKYPAIPANGASSKAELALAETAQILTGARGDGMDRALTPRDLVDLGMLSANFSSRGGLTIGRGDSDTDTTPVGSMGVPTGVGASGGFTYIVVYWDPLINVPSYAYAEVWRNATDAFATATRVATVRGSSYADPVDMESAFYYWVRFVNTDDVAGPIHATNGVFAETAPDPVALLNALTDSVTSSQLHADLRTPIDSIGTLTQDVVNLTTTVNDPVTGVTKTASALSLLTTDVETIDGVVTGVSASQMVKLDVNNHIAGYGLYNDGGSSQFIVSSSTFAVGFPEKPNVIPFIISNVEGSPVIALNATALIPDASITGGRIANVTIEDSNIARGTITGAAIAGGTITGAEIGSSEITGSHIEGGSITGTHIEGGSIIDTHIDTGAVGTLKIAGEAVTIPSAGEFVGNINIAFTNSSTVTDWTLIDGGPLVVNYGANFPAKIAVLMSVNMLPVAAGGTSVLAVAMSANGVPFGDVAVSLVSDFATTITSGGVVNGASSVTFRIYAKRSIVDATTYKTGRTYISGLGTKR